MYKYIKNNVHNMLITFQEIPSCDAFSRLQDGIWALSNNQTLMYHNTLSPMFVICQKAFYTLC
jgi:hypothetical protein